MTIVSVASHKCLDVANASNVNGAGIQLWECTGVDNQKWYVNRPGSVSLPILSKHTQKVLDVTNAATDNGSKVQQWQWSGVPNQMWDIVPILSRAGPQYYIRSSNGNNKCLDVAGNSHENGTDIQIWDCTGVENQKWIFMVAPDPLPVGVAWKPEGSNSGTGAPGANPH